MEQALENLVSQKDAELEAQYGKLADNAHWKWENARNELVACTDKKRLQEICYRPFDDRYTFKAVKSEGFFRRPRFEVMQHVQEGNIGFCAMRQFSDVGFTFAFVASCMIDNRTFSSNRGKVNLFPLYVAHSSSKNNEHDDMFAKKEREENFSPTFRKWLDKKYGKKYTPEQVLGYIYAVLHSPTFRTRYQELLKLDFPRIPFVETAKQFEALSALGWELVQAHLMKTIPDGVSVELKGKGDGKVTMMNYVEATQQLHINDTQYFTNISPVAWNFTIGGYQVLDKYLKSRKQDERPLGLTELRHIPKVVRILAWTDKKMQEIDKVFYPKTN